jgi:hypothetical protein
MGVGQCFAKLIDKGRAIIFFFFCKRNGSVNAENWTGRRNRRNVRNKSQGANLVNRVKIRAKMWRINFVDIRK